MDLFKLKPITPIEFATLVRPGSPNTYLVCPTGLSDCGPDKTSPIFEQARDTVLSAWLEMIERQPRTIETNPSTDGYQRTFVQRTRLLGFPDVITVQFISISPESSTLAIYSRSQYGHSDLGANKKRVMAWLSDLENRLG